MLEELKKISDIATVAWNSAEQGSLDASTYASVFESIVTSLNFLIAAAEVEKAGCVA